MSNPRPIDPSQTHVQRMIAQAMRDAPNPVGAETRAAAWLESLPPLDSMENVRLYVARIAYAAKHRIIRPTAITQHLYMAQVAISALKGGPK